MKLAKMIALAFALLVITTTTASAQGTATAVSSAPFLILREIGVGIVIMGAAMGIGGLGKAAVESMARQPEMAGTIQIAMIIAAALIEGATFFALIVIGFK